MDSDQPSQKNQSSVNRYDVLVFSLFGRNTWLAAQLRALGLRVAFFDLSSLYQKGLAEDWEGPFPLMFSDNMARTYSQSYTEQDTYDVLLRGPSLKVKSKGVFEFKSEHLPYMAEKWEQKGIWFREDEPVLPSAIKKLDYKSLWLKSFLKQWRATSLNPLGTVSSYDIPDFPLNCHYIVRHASRSGFIEGPAWLKEVGVDVLPVSSWWKAKFNESQNAWTFQVENEEHEIQANQILLGLTSYELHRFSGQLELKENEITVPKAFWMRWRAQCKSTDKLDFIPTYSMYLSDIEMGLCNENFMTVIKRPDKQLDIWACLSLEVLSEQNFQESIQTLIKKRMKDFVPEFHDLEMEGLRLGSDLYSFWPVYEHGQKYGENQIKAKNKNIILDNPEAWSALDNYSKYLYQTQIIEKFKNEVESQQGAQV